jgi:hypothetical protein
MVSEFVGVADGFLAWEQRSAIVLTTRGGEGRSRVITCDVETLALVADRRERSCDRFLRGKTVHDLAVAIHC